MPQTTQKLNPKDTEKQTVKFHDSITEAVGQTPLVKIRKMTARRGITCTILVKLEFLNPMASVKDRMAVWVLNDAIKEGKLKPGQTIIEATSGNTGAAVAMFAAAHGYKAILTVPDKISGEKLDTMRAFGVKLVVCPSDVPVDSEDNYYQAAKRIHRDTPNSYFLEQYQNTKNIDAHYYTTGPEIWKQTNGALTCFVGGIGTGGTVSGVARYLKEQNSEIEVVAADPIGSIYYQYHKDCTLVEPGTYLVEGIGEDMVCQSIDMSVIDKIYQVTDQECFETARELARTEGIFAGGSSGAALHVALKHAKGLDPEATVLVILPDSGMKYVSKFYNDEWISEKGLSV